MAGVWFGAAIVAVAVGYLHNSITWTALGVVGLAIGGCLIALGAP